MIAETPLWVTVFGIVVWCSLLVIPILILIWIALRFLERFAVWPGVLGFLAWLVCAAMFVITAFGAMGGHTGPSYEMGGYLIGFAVLAIGLWLIWYLYWKLGFK